MPGPPPPPPPTFNLGGGTCNDQGRNMLLQSIRDGKTLKKTVTNDKSAPAVSGRVKGDTTDFISPVHNSNGSSITNNNGNSGMSGGPMGLGGLFASGMPKLKPTGLRGNISERDSNNSTNSTTSNNSATMLTSTPSMRRGPPPVPPPAAQKPQVFVQSQSSNDVSNTSTDGLKGYNKPTLAPKPPPSSIAPQKPSPPLKKLNLPSSGSVSRAQSMRLPRSPPVVPPTPSSLHQSQDCLNDAQPRTINRVLRPPVQRPPSPPTSRSNSLTTATRAAPPPPPSRTAVTAPCIPPPPPPFPHRPAPSHQRLAPPLPPPPTPPVRNLSMRNGQTMASIDLEIRFAEMFHPVSSFPPPEPFRGFVKTYSSRNVAKQPAPAPPLRSAASGTMHSMNVSPGSKQWQQNAPSLAY